MKTKLLSALAVVLVSLPAFSQTPDSVMTKNHLGILASPTLEKLFSNNRSMPVGLIYKRQVKENQAIRMSVMATYHKTSLPYNYNSIQSNLNTTTYFSTYYMLGYEWQRSLNDHWALFFGADGGMGFSKSSNDYDNKDRLNSQFYGTISTSETESRSYIFKPFAGIKFRITPRFYLASETSIFLTKYTSDLDVDHHSYSSGILESTITDPTRTYKSTNLTYSPITNIQLVYQF